MGLVCVSLELVVKFSSISLLPPPCSQLPTHLSFPLKTKFLKEWLILFYLPFLILYLLSPKAVKLLSSLLPPRSAMTLAHFNSVAFGADDLLSLTIISPLADVILSWFPCLSDHCPFLPLGPEILFLCLFSSP